MAWSTTQPKKAELFASELKSQFSCPPENANTNQIVAETIRKLLLPMEIQHIPPNEVWEIIKNLTRNKAPGPDRITNIALKHSSKRTILHLTKIFNSCLRLEYFPKPWKIANMVMIPKTGKNQLTPTNHRPISLINTMAKIFESLHLIRLKKSFASHLRPEQFAFRQGHSTTIQLMD